MKNDIISNLDIKRLSKNIQKQLTRKNFLEKETGLCAIQEILAKSLGFNNLRDFNIAREKTINNDDVIKNIFNLRDFILNKIVDYQANTLNFSPKDKNILLKNKNNNIKKLINFKSPNLNKHNFNDIMEMFFILDDDLKEKTTYKSLNIAERISISEIEMSKMCDLCQIEGKDKNKVMSEYYLNYDLIFSSVVILEIVCGKWII